MEKLWLTVLATAFSLYLMRAVLKFRRSGRLSFQYASGWMLFLLLLLLTALLLGLIPRLANALGLATGVMVAGISGGVLLVICVQLSISISVLQEQVSLLAEEISLARQEIGHDHERIPQSDE